MENLILENKNLIYSMTRYFEKYCNKEDLFQAGCIGMIIAYKNFDESMGVKFTTYAYPYILGEMKKVIRESRSVKVSRNIQLLSLKIEKAKILLTQKLMREPTNIEISNYLEIPIDVINEAINSNMIVYSIDEPINKEGKIVTLQDMLGNNKIDNIDDLILLKDELSKLSEFEKKLIQTRYENDLTQQETAEILGISQVQVSRKEQKILLKLKDKLTVNKLAS
ncbi:MAG: sigma-70 family RNA polymerase sigma factor [Firmicutes bacterium]|nr:sigma-70 family RNA polymerase sigma factor [Bacillota bacterium]